MSQYLKKGGLDEAAVFDLTLAMEVVTPAQIVANQNDYNPGSPGIWRLDSDAARNITGILAPVVDGTLLKLVNIGAFTITLKYLDGASAAANQIKSTSGADVAIAPNQIVDLEYDLTTAKWRAVVAAAAASGGAGEKVFNYLTFQ